MHDIVDLESRGVPGVFVASSEFVSGADAQSAALGFPDVARIFVEHPIQDRTDDEALKNGLLISFSILLSLLG